MCPRPICLLNQVYFACVSQVYYDLCPSSILPFASGRWDTQTTTWHVDDYNANLLRQVWPDKEDLNRLFLLFLVNEFNEY